MTRNSCGKNFLDKLLRLPGDGRLREENPTCREFRDYLGQIPSLMLIRYADECLTDSFQDCGLALQDIVNEVGRRLGLSVINGRYRGAKGEVGNDGLWTLPDGRRIAVEVKTTDAYRMDLDRIASYARELELSQKTQEVYTLIVVGRSDTGDLEAQIRGSRHAWEMRLISVDALLCLMQLKEELEEPGTLAKIHEILVPREFTKLDGIVDLVFSTAEEAKQTDVATVLPEAQTKGKKFTPVAFNDACADRVSKHIEQPLIKRSRATFSSPNAEIVVICLVSKKHAERKPHNYWFAFHPHQRENLAKAKKSFVALGCGSPDIVFLIPFDDFQNWLSGMNVTQLEDRMYWHIQIHEDQAGFKLVRRKGEKKIELFKYLLA
jgi:hypothetical protein